MEPNLGIKAAAVGQVHEMLNKLLSMQATLYTNTLKSHWNVVGPAFAELHKLFGKQYESLFDNMDVIAERIRALGKFPVASMDEWMKLSSGMPFVKSYGAMGMVTELVQGNEYVIREMRAVTQKAQEANDIGTVNMLSAMIEGQEKNAWMLRAHLEAAK